MRAHCVVAIPVLVAVILLPRQQARAGAQGVGLGVAAGVDLHRAKDAANASDFKTGSSFDWGFFVDIPLLDTFYITPAAMLYELDIGNGTDKSAVTDVDLNFKFIVPLGAMRLGAGITAGLTTGLGDYLGHYGLLGYASLNLVSNIELFALLQYKSLAFGGQTIQNYHGYVGSMFVF